MNHKVFFDHARTRPFKGRLTKQQVEGCEAILDGAVKRGWDDRWTAYALATAYHETARTMQPIAEYGRGKGHRYGKRDPETGKVYYGRGYVQLTWKANYSSMAQITGANLVDNPDLALEPVIAAEILFAGMERGTFTGRKLENYFVGDIADWVGARKIINGTDRDDLIAGYGRDFHAAMRAARTTPDIPPPPDIEPIDPRPENKTKYGIATAIVAALAAAVAWAWTHIGNLYDVIIP